MIVKYDICFAWQKFACHDRGMGVKKSFWQTYYFNRALAAIKVGFVCFERKLHPETYIWGIHVHLFMYVPQIWKQIVDDAFLMPESPELFLKLFAREKAILNK